MFWQIQFLSFFCVLKRFSKVIKNAWTFWTISIENSLLFTRAKTISMLTYFQRTDEWTIYLANGTVLDKLPLKIFKDFYLIVFRIKVPLILNNFKLFFVLEKTFNFTMNIGTILWYIWITMRVFFFNLAVISSNSEKKNSWPLVFLILATSLQISEFMMIVGQRRKKDLYINQNYNSSLGILIWWNQITTV